MKRGDPIDPLFLQVVSQVRERDFSDQAHEDPLSEAGKYIGKGLLKKYNGRALLVATGVCAIHCRYCFRRHNDYGETSVSGGALDSAIQILTKTPDISEVILSGGDPLSLSDRKLCDLFAKLEAISSINTIRIHSRTLTAVPSRVTGNLLKLIENCRKRVVIITHTNHGNEWDGTTKKAILRLGSRGATLLNQSVLLKGVNDNAQALINLSLAMFEAGVLPYYVHLLDPVAGAEHFNVSASDALALKTEIGKELPGYLVPKFVKEIPGEGNKTDLSELLSKN